MEFYELGTCCDDCVQAIANDDYTGMDDAREQEVRAGLERIGEYLIVGDEYGFSWRRCDVCDGLAGNRHDIGYLA